MTKLSPTLDELGNALQASAEADLGATTPAPRRRHTRRLVLVTVVLAVAIPSVAFGSRLFTSTHDVEQSLPAGTAMLAGTDPTCTVVKEGVEFHCVLAHKPLPEISDMKGTVESTVDATKHVNGGCRSLRSDGLEWECYLGQAAVDQQIIGQSFLGEFAPAPGRG